MVDYSAESRLSVLEERLGNVALQSAQDREELKDAVIELKNAVLKLTTVQIEAEQFSKDLHRLQGALDNYHSNTSADIVNLKERVSVMEDKISRSWQATWGNKAPLYIITFLVLFVLGLGWADLQLQYMHERDLDIINHVTTPTPYNVTPSKPPKAVE